MAFEMIDGEIGLPESQRESLGDGRADHERAGQTRPAGRRKRVHFA